jgi:hypothetical protein
MRTYMEGPKNLKEHMEPEEAAAFALDYFLDPVNPKDLSLHDWEGHDYPW